MADETQGDQNIQADNSSIAIGGIRVGGNVGDIRIGHTIGFTSEQVSTLITQISTTFQPKLFDGRCPYKGLEVFQEKDAELFFGRERLVDDLISRVKESRMVFVTGSSGSGKSSLVRAGLIPALKKAGTFSEHWLYASLKPGRDPIEALALALSRLKDPALGKYFRENAGQASVLQECAESALSDDGEQRLALFIDQFEEVFTQLSREKAETFINLLAHAATVENGRVITLFSMRSDFIPNCQTYPKLNALLGQKYAFAPIGAMQNEELVSAIAQPALRVGLRIDPDLIAQIINDMGGEPGALPLMQFALKDLFDSQQEKGSLIALTLNDYLGRGGIRKALERHADQTFAAFSTEEQELARSIFTGLIEIGRGTQDTRRTAIFDELVPASAQSTSVEAIVGKLADARLLTTDEIGGKDTVTISHEKLIDAWPWLKKLVNENRDVIALQNEIAEDAKEWGEHQRDASYLYSGARLATAQEKMTSQKIVLSGLAKDFIQEGIALREKERRAKESLRRKITTGLIAGIAIALVLAGFAFYAMRQAQNLANIARAGELSALAISNKEKHSDLASLFSIEGWNKFKNSRTKSTLLTLTNSYPGLSKYLFGHKDSVLSVAFSPNGKLLASGSKDNTIILWDVSNPESPSQLTALSMQSYIFSAAFSPDGKVLALGSGDNTIILWDVSNPESPSQLTTLSKHDGSVTSVAFSPDGKLLASGSTDITIILWDVSDPQSASPLATLSKHINSVASVAFSPNGKLLASGSIDASIILWDVSDPQSASPLATLSKHREGVNSVAFSPDGKLLASGSEDNTIILWDVGDPQSASPLATLSKHIYGIYSVAFSPDGKVLASASSDTTIILWDVGDPESASHRATLSGHGDYVNSVAFSPDGKILASGSDDYTVILWDAGDPKSTLPLTTLSKHREGVNSVAFSPNGKLLASGSEDNTIILWDVGDPKSASPLATLSGQGDYVNSVAFSPNGKLLASGNGDNTIILWDVGDPKSASPLATLSKHDGSVTSLAFSPNGKLLASGSDDYTVILWDVSDPKSASPLTTLSGHGDYVNSVAFSPDGKLLASGSDDYTVILWDVGDPKSASPLATLSGHIFNVNSVEFSPDSTQLASGGGDYTVRLWDVSNPKSASPIATLSGHSDYVNSVAFDPADSEVLASGSLDNTIILQDLDPDSWIEKSCQRVNRNFTRAEWEQYFHGEEYRKTCK